MLTEKNKIVFATDIMSDAVEMYFYNPGECYFTIGKDAESPNPIIVTHNIDEGSKMEPFLRLHSFIATDMLQKLADALYKINIKPTALKTTENEMTLIKEHLEDMRQLVFGFSIIPKEK